MLYHNMLTSYYMSFLLLSNFLAFESFLKEKKSLSQSAVSKELWQNIWIKQKRGIFKIHFIFGIPFSFAYLLLHVLSVVEFKTDCQKSS